MPDRLSAWLHHGYKRTSSMITSPREDQPSDGQPTINNQILNVEPKRRQWHLQSKIVIRPSTSRIMHRVPRFEAWSRRRFQSHEGRMSATKPNPTQSGT